MFTSLSSYLTKELSKLFFLFAKYVVSNAQKKKNGVKVLFPFSSFHFLPCMRYFPTYIFSQPTKETKEKEFSTFFFIRAKF